MSAALFKEITPVNLSNDPSVVFSLGGNPLYRMDAQSLTPVTDGGSLRWTVNAEAADYWYHQGLPNGVSSAYDATVGSNLTSASLLQFLGNAAGESVNGSWFIPLADSAFYKNIWGSAAQVDNSGNIRHNTYVGYWGGGTDALSSITLFGSGTNLTGRIVLSGLALHRPSDVGKWYGNVTLREIIDISDDPFIDVTIAPGFKRHYIIPLGVVPSVDGANMYGRIGTAGGIQAGSNAYHDNVSVAGVSSYASIAGLSASVMLVSGDVGNDSGEHFCQMLGIPNPPGGYKIISSHGALNRTNGSPRMINGAGAYLGSTDQLTTYRIIPSAGLLAVGKLFVYAEK